MSKFSDVQNGAKTVLLTVSPVAGDGHGNRVYAYQVTADRTAMLANPMPDVPFFTIGMAGGIANESDPDSFSNSLVETGSTLEIIGFWGRQGELWPSEYDAGLKAIAWNWRESILKALHSNQKLNDGSNNTVRGLGTITDQTGYLMFDDKEMFGTVFTVPFEYKY